MAISLSQRYANTRSNYTQLWKTVKLDDSARARVKAAVAKIIQYRDVYEKTVKGWMLPWWWVGCIHYRESSNNFRTHLHNGDPLSARTKNVPKGRPLVGEPPFTWDVSAADALKMKDLDKLADVSIEHLLFQAQRFNGFGYEDYHPQDLSPYVWAGTNHSDETGKYVKDGRYDPNAPERQLGVAALMLGLQGAGVDLSAKREAGQLTKEAVGTAVTTVAVGGGTALATHNWWIIGGVALVVCFIAFSVGYALWKRRQK